jgi:hypothetical protein
MKLGRARNSSGDGAVQRLNQAGIGGGCDKIMKSARLARDGSLAQTWG